MGEPIQGSDQHSPRLDEELVREQPVEDETVETDLWDRPGRDGVVTESESDPDRTDLRAEIGTYVSRVRFPARGAELVAAAEAAGASDRVLSWLNDLNGAERYANAAEVWTALDLGSGRRS